MRTLLFTLLPILLSETVSAQEKSSTHTDWDRQLQTYVVGGRVDYASWKKEETRLDTYLLSLRDISAETLKTMGREEQLALYINAYNAYTVKTILQNPGIKSIRNIKPNAWKSKFVQIAGETISLDHLEHKILRPVFKEPRVHFAIVCASISCPPLAGTAFTADNLEMLLTQNTRAYLADTAQNRFSAQATELSKIFSWFKEDFGGKNGLRKFLSVYAPAGYTPEARVTYLPYNWSLNSK